MTSRIIGALLLTISASIGIGVTQTSGPTATQPDRTVHVTVNGVQILGKDLANLVRGLFEAGTKQVDTIKKNPAEMPTQSPYVYYVGRNTVTARETIWESSESPPESDAKRMSDEYTAAYALAAIDAGYVGAPWKSLYSQSARDDASRLAYNYDYAPGKPIVSGNMVGCGDDDEDDRLAAAWPYAGEHLPKRTGGCALTGPRKPEPFPFASMTLPGAFSIACGSRIGVEMTFATGDRLQWLDISKPVSVCV
jgi:hypothetical protein